MPQQWRNIDALIQGIEGVIEVEDVRGHRFGPYLVLNVTIGVDGRKGKARLETVRGIGVAKLVLRLEQVGRC